MLALNLNKALPLIFLPLGLSLILMGAALRWRLRILIAVAMLVLGLLGTPLLANILMRSLEDRYPYESLGDCPQADAIFVFGGMLDARDRLDGSIAWNDAAERFDRAVRLVREGKAPLLVLSGGAERYPGGGDEGQLLRAEAVTRGIAEQSLLVTARTADTKAEASKICELAEQRQWKRVLLVTSAYHMPRAMRLTSGCKAERIAVPVAYRTPAPGSSWVNSRLETYLPQAQALSNSELALREYLGMLLTGT